MESIRSNLRTTILCFGREKSESVRKESSRSGCGLMQTEYSIQDDRTAGLRPVITRHRRPRIQTGTPMDQMFQHIGPVPIS